MALLAAIDSLSNVSPGSVYLAAGGLLLYVASRAGADALAGGVLGRPGLRAIGHCLPIAVIALLCLRPSMGRADLDADSIGRPQVAVGLLFGASVACLTLVLGVATYLAPLGHLPATRKAWPFVLPVSLLVLVAGFNGEFSWLHAGALIVLGGSIANLWIHAGADEPPTLFATGDLIGPPAEAAWVRWPQFLLSLALTAVGGWAVSRGILQTERTHRLFSGVLLAGAVVAPMITLPVLGATALLAERGHTHTAVSTLVAMVLINLCAILPLVILAHHALAWFYQPGAIPVGVTTAPAARVLVAAVPFPIISWRVDTILLAVVGFGMIPWSIGRWTISRAESLALIFGYAIYLALVAILSTRWH